ncbi:hypothetical protein PUV47_09095 [Pseudovibrio exalbescens]|uniref:hypothetical protein n=1 Tax=Pseudovibrio exalbescens TaxID=197461 RepID=UPI0023668033|nr:hypothetical protein [Pseudovibrio exalbescens]MDD7910074.1 hypothetical protein [Pseudovibrio exalbescens]
MLPSLTEVRHSVQGSWLLVKGRSEGMSYFDLSADGFWRSFTVLLYVLPFYMLGNVTEAQLGKELGEPLSANGGGLLPLPKLFTLVLDWIGFPIILAFLASLLAVRNTYGAYVTVRNWTTLVVVIPHAALNLLYLAGVLNADMLLTLSLFVVGWVLWVHFTVARIALSVGAGLAIGLVVLDFILSLFIVQIVDQLFSL